MNTNGKKPRATNKKATNPAPLRQLPDDAKIRYSKGDLAMIEAGRKVIDYLIKREEQEAA